MTAGVQPVQVIHQIPMGSPPVPHLGFTSNVAAFVLRPTIQSVVVNNLAVASSGLRAAVLHLHVSPAVGDLQRVVLILNEFHPPPGRAALTYAFGAPSRATLSPPTPISSTCPSAKSLLERMLVRVQIDGAENPLGD